MTDTTILIDRDGPFQRVSKNMAAVIAASTRRRAARAARDANVFGQVEAADWDQTPIGTLNVRCENPD